jgi:hypothetical protein
MYTKNIVKKLKDAYLKILPDYMNNVHTRFDNFEQLLI